MTLTATDWPLHGMNITFEEHDTRLFGRSLDYHARLAETAAILTGDITPVRKHVTELRVPVAGVIDHSLASAAANCYTSGSEMRTVLGTVL